MQSWSVAMASTSGGSRGRKPRQCEHFVLARMNFFTSPAPTRKTKDVRSVCDFPFLQVRVLRLPFRHRRPDEAVWTGPLGPPNGRKGNRLTFSHCSFPKRPLLQKGQGSSISGANCNHFPFTPLCSRYVD